MAYDKILIHGETEGQLDDDDRFLQVKTEDGAIVLYCEDDAYGLPTTIDTAEALALIRALTEAIGDLT
jgi:hypothetical protein